MLFPAFAFDLNGVTGGITVNITLQAPREMGTQHDIVSVPPPQSMPGFKYIGNTRTPINIVTCWC